MLSVDSAACGPYSSAMTGEYELGSSAVDGLEGYINGNYGVVYTFRLELALERARSAYAFLLQPSGGFGHYSFEVGGDAAVSPFASHRGDLVVLPRSQLRWRGGGAARDQPARRLLRAAKALLRSPPLGLGRGASRAWGARDTPVTLCGAGSA